MYVYIYTFIYLSIYLFIVIRYLYHLYYLYYLEKKGIAGVIGNIHYPRSKKKEIVELTVKDREVLDKTVRIITAIKIQKTPPPIEKEKKCKKCSYYELCFC